MYKDILFDHSKIPDNSHMLGDTAYHIMRNLLVGYKDNGQLDARKKKFNVTLSSARVAIERAFGMLKCRFRRLKYLDMSRIDLIPEVIMA